MRIPLLIENGLVVDPLSGFSGAADLLIEGGIIAAIGRFPYPKNAYIIKAEGKVVAPGFVDMHVHFRQPGHEEKETFKSGGRSAIRGGYTAVACMPNTDPPLDDPHKVEQVLRKYAGDSLADIFAIGAITKGQKGAELADIAGMKTAGVVAISDDGREVMDSALLRRAFVEAKKHNLLVISHCEDMSLSKGGAINDGEVAKKLGIPGIPPAAEDIMVWRDIRLAEDVGCRLHIAHVSTAGAVAIIREAKRRGACALTCETAPHYFALTEEAVMELGPLAKMNPPLRTKVDAAAIKEGLADGTIDAIATDHAPHTAEEKNRPLELAPFGVIGLETALPVAVMELLDEGVLTLEWLIEKLSSKPAEILGIRKGPLRHGAVADIAVIDLVLREEVRQLESKSRNCPWLGKKLKGFAATVVKNGEILMENRKLRD